VADPDTNPANTRQYAFFHALSKVKCEATQRVWSSLYKSAHSIRNDDIWADPVGYAVDAAAADVEAGSNPAVTKRTLLTLTEVPGSNQQAYYLDVGGQWVRPWIAPTDVPEPTSNDPSYGYQAQLYRGDDALITPTAGTWEIDYYAGIIRFFPGSTPPEQGWGAVKVTCYQYSGAFGGGMDADKIVTAQVDLFVVPSMLYNAQRFALVVVDSNGNVVVAR
jgi:hypothetical protein